MKEEEIKEALNAFEKGANQILNVLRAKDGDTWKVVKLLRVGENDYCVLSTFKNSNIIWTMRELSESICKKLEQDAEQITGMHTTIIRSFPLRKA